MPLTRRAVVASNLACLFALGLVTGCEEHRDLPSSPWTQDFSVTPMAECDPDVTVEGDSPALMVTDPEALEKLQLKAVLTTLLARSADAETTPLELMQRLFDTNNADASGHEYAEMHCDTSTNFAHANGPATECPRAEGALAASDGFFEAGHPDHFYPVAVVNRMDLSPITGSSCGEYRIVYAKESGLTDPNNRVFLIFEGALANPEPGNLARCQSVARFWKELESAPDAAELGEQLRHFFMDGLNGFGPVVSPLSFGLGGTSSGGYYGDVATPGQIRVSQHMDDHWQMRQFVLGSGFLRFVPVPVSNNPMPHLFETSADILGNMFQEELLLSVPSYGAREITSIRGTVNSGFLAGESELGGEGVNDYAARAKGNQYLHDAVADQIASYGVGADCPEGDPLTPEHIIQRANMDSCAGCHAPAQFLGAERKIGCGMEWPASLGETHLDEKGNRSPALTEVFLPHRAEVMTKMLRSCNSDELIEAFGGTPAGGTTTKSLDRRRTIGGSQTH